MKDFLLTWVPIWTIGFLGGVAIGVGLAVGCVISL